jgi:hypothetical protein
VFSTSETQADTAAKVDAAIAALARELQGFVLDTAKLISPMIKDGRLKGREAIAAKMLACYEDNQIVMILERSNPWLVPAVASVAFPKRDMILHEAWLGTVTDDEACMAHDGGGAPGIPENGSAAKETAMRAAQAIFMFAIFETLTELGTPIGS